MDWKAAHLFRKGAERPRKRTANTITRRIETGIPMAATVRRARRKSASLLTMRANLIHQRRAIAGTATKRMRKAIEPSPETMGTNLKAKATRMAQAVVLIKLASLQAWLTLAMTADAASAMSGSMGAEQKRHCRADASMVSLQLGH